MLLHIGIDDTDSPSGGCTTYIAALLVELLLELQCEFVDYPNLLRLNPNAPWKTRGNGAVCLRVNVDEVKLNDIKKMVIDIIEDHGIEMPGIRRVNWATRAALKHLSPGSVWLLDALDYPPDGDDCAARMVVQAYELGWPRIIAYNWRGGRFAGCGLGPDSHSLRLDLYGDVGDYAASGLDGAEVHLHGDGQDQVGQIFKRGKLVIHGEAGQTFLYGAKGGEIYVLGSAAGRPLINAVGRPRAVINGTCLDYLAESFMAGDPQQHGGFVILTGMVYDERGCLQELESPYPGGNLFSLASGGAIYLRDPHHRVQVGQLNGGAFSALRPQDWQLIKPYLVENERLFGIHLAELLAWMASRARRTRFIVKWKFGG